MMQFASANRSDSSAKGKKSDLPSGLASETLEELSDELSAMLDDINPSRPAESNGAPSTPQNKTA